MRAPSQCRCPFPLWAETLIVRERRRRAAV